MYSQSPGQNREYSQQLICVSPQQKVHRRRIWEDLYLVFNVPIQIQDKGNPSWLRGLMAELRRCNVLFLGVSFYSFTRIIPR